MSKHTAPKALPSYVIITLFLLLLTIPTVMHCIVGDLNGDTLDEKRSAAAFPTVFSDDYLAEFEKWYADNVPYRSTLITFYKKAVQSYSSVYRERIHPLVSRLFTPSWYNSSEPYYAPLIDTSSGYVIYGKNGWMFINDSGSLRYYLGTNFLSTEEMTAWKSIYEQLDSLCLERGIKLVVFTAPNKELVYSDQMPSYSIQASPGRSMLFYEFMKQRSSVSYLFPLKELIKARNSFDVYYKQDTHWNFYGAYIGISAVYEALGMKPNVPEIKETRKSGGDLSDVSGFISEYTDYDIEYRPDINVTRNLADNTTFETYLSDSDNPATILVIGDSFRSYLPKYLSKDFSTSLFAHRDNEKDSKYIEQALDTLSAGDVLLLITCERSDAANVILAGKIIDHWSAD